MKLKLYIYMMLLLSLTLYGEIISDGINIRKLIYAKPLQRGGFYTSYNFDYIIRNSDSLHTNSTNKLSFGYGIVENVDFFLTIPYYTYWRNDLRVKGFGDTRFALKYFFSNPNNKFSSAFIGKLTLPLGFNEKLSSQKKGYAIKYLCDYSKPSFSIHANFGFMTLDNFSLKNKDDMTINYAIGFQYKLLNQYKNNLWIKWEFETTNSLLDYPKYIIGSQYLGLTQNLAFGLSLNAGAVYELYQSNSYGFSAGIDYSLQGTQKNREKKLFEKYGQNLKIGLFEFVNDDTLKTYSKISDEFKLKLNIINSIEVNKYENSLPGIYGERQYISNYLTNSGTNLIVQGKVLKSDFIRSNSFKIPFLIYFPENGYNIEINILVFDPIKNKIVFNENISAISALDSSPSLFSNKLNYHFSASEEYQLINKCRQNVVKKTLKRLSNKFE